MGPRNFYGTKSIVRNTPVPEAKPSGPLTGFQHVEVPWNYALSVTATGDGINCTDELPAPSGVGTNTGDG